MQEMDASSLFLGTEQQQEQAAHRSRVKYFITLYFAWTITRFAAAGFTAEAG